MGLCLSSSGPKHFLYLSDQRVVTVELLDEQMVILNFINLGDNFEFFRAHELVLVDSGGHLGKGHLIVLEDPVDPEEIYQVGDLVKPRTFLGHNIAGYYRFETGLAKCYLKLGGRILGLEPLTMEAFEQVASMVSEIDLESDNPTKMIQNIGFTRGYGDLYTGSDIGPLLGSYFPDEEVTQTLLLENPKPQLPEYAANLSEPVVIVVSATISRTGGIFDLKIVEGIDKQLDSLALDSVQNSWRFLPAISKGKIVVSELILNVLFQKQL